MADSQVFRLVVEGPQVVCYQSSGDRPARARHHSIRQVRTDEARSTEAVFPRRDQRRGRRDGFWLTRQSRGE